MKVVTLCNHLSADQQIDCAGRKLHQYVLEAASPACRVAVQPRHIHRWKHLPQPGLELVSSFADIVHIFAVAGGAALGNRPDVVAVMALKTQVVLVESESHVAVLALDGEATRPAYQE